MALTSKDVGVAGEHFFAFRALEQGFDVSFPTGDKSKFDLVVGNGRELLRIQIKTANTLVKGRYNFQITAAQQRQYACDDFDILVLIVLPERCTYIKPANIGTQVQSIGLAKRDNNNRFPSKWDVFLERWDYIYIETSGNMRAADAG